MVKVSGKVVGAGVAAAAAVGLGLYLLKGDGAQRFTTVLRDGAMALRDYPELIVAETRVAGYRDHALSEGLVVIADFLNGQAGVGGAVPIGAPLMADGTDDGMGRWRTRLIVPADAGIAISGEDEDATVWVRAVAPRRVAAIRFSGEADEPMLNQREAELRAWIEGRALSITGSAEHAFYDSPLTPPALRRNEVIIPVAA